MQVLNSEKSKSTQKKLGKAAEHAVAAATLSDADVAALCQEYEADDYGYNFLKKNGYDAKGMAAALRKIQALQDDSQGKVNALFSSHPDSGKRAERLEARAE